MINATFHSQCDRCRRQSGNGLASAALTILALLTAAKDSSSSASLPFTLCLRLPTCNK